MQITKLKSQAESETRDSYSRCVVVDKWVFVAITAGVEFGTRNIPAGPAEQASKVIDNLEASLREAGSCLEDVVKTQVYIPYQKDFETVIEVYADRFRGIDPANTVVCTPLGAPDLRVEMEATAYIGAGSAQQVRRSILV
jgi:enamine deaminase RidA (YjgF/YER057c/UK114 family)